MGSPTTVFARIPFMYAKQDLERGEITVLKGSPRDDQLRGLRYLELYNPAIHERKGCDNCGKVFASDGFRIAHRSKKGGCLAPSSEITRDETAMLLDVDPKSVVMEG